MAGSTTSANRSNRSIGWAAPRRGRSPGTDRSERRADRVEDGCRGWRTLLAPQGVAEADQGEAGRDGEQPLVLRHQADRAGGQGAKSEEDGSTPGEDVGAEDRDGEDAAASHIGDAGEQDGGLHQPDVAGGGTIVGHGDDVTHVGGGTVSDGW